MHIFKAARKTNVIGVGFAFRPLSRMNNNMAFTFIIYSKIFRFDDSDMKIVFHTSTSYYKWFHEGCLITSLLQHNYFTSYSFLEWHKYCQSPPQDIFFPLTKDILNLYLHNVPFLYPLKTSEKVFSYFQEV